jgi:biotin transport system substrate-specific component
VSREQTGLVQGANFFIAALLGGVVAVYGLGVTYLAFVTGMGFLKAFIGSLAFIPGDVLKALIAALAGRAVMVGYPLLPQRAST